MYDRKITLDTFNAFVCTRGMQRNATQRNATQRNATQRNTDAAAAGIF